MASPNSTTSADIGAQITAAVAPAVGSTPVEEGNLSETPEQGKADESFALDVFEALDSFDPDEGGESESSMGGTQGLSTPPVPVSEPLEAQPAQAPVAPASSPAPIPPAVAQPAIVPAAVNPPALVPAIAPVAPPAVPGQPGQTPASAQAAAQPPASAEVPQATNPLEVFKREVEKNKDVFTTALAGSIYKLNQEQADALTTNPETEVPKLLARAHVEIVQNVIGAISQQLPAAIGGYIQAQKVHSETEDRFFAAFPQLDRVKDRATVIQFAGAFRAANPQASFEDMARIVGVQSLVALGKFQTQPTAQQPTAQQAQVFAPPAFVPAQANGGALAPQRVPQGYEALADALAMDFDD